MCEWRIPDTGNESEGGAWGQETRVAGRVGRPGQGQWLGPQVTDGAFDKGQILGGPLDFGIKGVGLG